MKWIRQFKMMKEKMINAMWKLGNIPVTVSNAYLYINMYLITHVYFGCGILNINPKQEEILMKLSEPVILKKIQLSVKFPREVLYARKSALGIGLMKPSTILAVLAAQLYFGYQRMKDDTSKMIQSIIDNGQVHYGYSKDIMEVNKEYKMEQTIWCDEVANMLAERKISVTNTIQNKIIDTANPTIMDLAIKYAEENQLSITLIPPINHVRYFKRMILPCELIGMSGHCKTFQFNNIGATSCIKWRVKFSTIPTPSKKTKEIWKDFLEWMIK